MLVEGGGKAADSLARVQGKMISEGPLSTFRTLS